MDASSEGGSFPSSAQPQAVSLSKTPTKELVEVADKRTKETNDGIDEHVKKCKLNPHNAVKLGSSQLSLMQSSTNNVLTPIFNQTRLENMVVTFVLKDQMPFGVVDKTSFVEMLKKAQPRFRVPDKKKIASFVWDLYATESARIKSVIGDQRVSITTDTWTSIHNIKYMVITIHFLDNDWKLRKLIINFSRITSHKGDDIGKLLETCLSNWGIDKVFTITSNNSMDDLSLEYMRKRLQDIGTLLLDGKYLHLKCCCHIINLIVKSGLKFLNESIKSIRNCVKYIHSSRARLDHFRECAILLGMDERSTVPMDAPTRWNSTYTMLSIAYKFKKVFDKMSQNVKFLEYFEKVEGAEKRKRVGPPNEEDWEKAQVFMNFPRRFHNTRLQLTSLKTSTSILLIWEDIVSMRMFIDETVRDITDPILQEVAKKMESKLKKYWGDLEEMNKVIFLGHVLDPRYKLQMFEFDLREMNLDGTRMQSFIDCLKNSLLELYHAYKQNSSLEHLDGVDEEKSFMEAYKDDPIRLRKYLQLIRFRKAQNQAILSNEVDKYFSDPFEGWSPSFDILEWWKGRTTVFPVLSKIAKDILAIPSSTVVGENVFSLESKVVDPFKAPLHPKTMEAFVCSSDWLRREEINLYKEPTKEEVNFYKNSAVTSTFMHQQSNASSTK